MTTYDLFTLGETMLRLSLPGMLRVEQANQFNINFGGAESNVAANLARLGKRTGWYSRLPNNPLGHACAAQLRGHGVDVSHVNYDDYRRMGVYYIEYGTVPRGIRVWYDRANSAASYMTAEDLPLQAIADSRWLHLTGITPALSDGCNEAARAALDHARANNVRVSFDVNYRALVWDARTAAETVIPYCMGADVVFVARRDAINLFGAPDLPEEAAYALQKQWGGTVIVTDGENGVFATNASETHHVVGPRAEIVDRIGAGDALASGVVCRLLEDASLHDALQFGTAMAAYALTMPGDIVVTHRSDIDQLLNSSNEGLTR